MLNAGVKVYQYTKGMMHSKLMMVDSRWASCGTANLDNRSLHLNFEVNCLLFDPAHVAELEAAFLRDLETASAVDALGYPKRPYLKRAAENVLRVVFADLVINALKDYPTTRLRPEFLAWYNF